MGQKICYIAGAGVCSRLFLQAKEEDFVIAVDGGYEYLKEDRVDLAIGDFDSLGYLPPCEERIVLQQEKDDTDMLAALKEGLERGYRLFYIYGGLGGRIDHSYANIQSLAYLAKHGARGYLFGADQTITMIQNEGIAFPEAMRGYLSVFSYGEKVESVTLKNLKYELTRGTLTDTFPLGVSNEFIGKRAQVSVRGGRLIVIFPVDQGMPVYTD